MILFTLLCLISVLIDSCYGDSYEIPILNVAKNTKSRRHVNITTAQENGISGYIGYIPSRYDDESTFTQSPSMYEMYDEYKRSERGVNGTLSVLTPQFVPLMTLIDEDKDTSQYWRETEILTLLKQHGFQSDEECIEPNSTSGMETVKLPSRRTVRPICRSKYDYQLCPQCPHFSNKTECMLFRDSCRERRVNPSEYSTYCDKKYGKWRAMFFPSDYSQCRCCDECVFYRELDQSCVHDEYAFESEETLPVTTIDFRAGCNTYWGHPDQEYRALKCDKTLRRCIPVTMPNVPEETINYRRSFRFERPPEDKICPETCRGYKCPPATLKEETCPKGAFQPDKNECNCCGTCSGYHQLNQKCAEFIRTTHEANGSMEIEVEEEFLEPGCENGLVCRQGRCQDIHSVETMIKRRRGGAAEIAKEPCKQELMEFKKRYGEDGHLHYNAPQCTPLWLYSPVQCRRFLCYCALEDGTRIQGIKVPRIEVSNMNCDCARERCRVDSDIECDGYGNYMEAVFTPHTEKWPDVLDKTNKVSSSSIKNTVADDMKPTTLKLASRT